MFQRSIPGVSLTLLLILISGCERASTGGVAVVDLDVVATAIGRDKVIAQQIQDFARQQEEKLKQLQNELRQQVSSANEKLGEEALEAEKQSLNSMVVQARSQLTRELDQARQSAQQLRLQLVREFAIEVQPVARRAAEARGLTVVMVKQPGLLVVAPEANITDAVIDSLHSSSKAVAATPQSKR